MTTPSIKGTAIASVFTDLLRLEEDGMLSTDELETRLEQQDLEYLREKIDLGHWYPLSCYERMVDLLIEKEGDDRAEYLRQRGWAAGERLSNAGLYAQLDLVERMDEQRREERFIQDVRLLASVYGSMFNVSDLSAREDPEDGIVLEVTGAEQLPDFLAEVILGMMNYLRRRIGADDRPYVLQRKSRSHWIYQGP